jgi:putative two-component system response regulator
MSHSGLILVVDDEELNRTLPRELLTHRGFQIAEARDGEDALHKVNQVGPDLILLDFRMSRIDGITVCRELKQDPRTQLIPIILLTALSAVDDRVAGIEAGADDFLSKPFHQAELVARVRSLIRVKHLTDQLERTENILFTMAAAVEAKDPYTEGHLRRLVEYSSEMSFALGLVPHLSTVIRYGALLHDVGKIGVPDAILQKPGALTLEEFDIIKQHPVFGERICQPLRFGAEVGPIVRNHHERWDGTGYPDGLAGEAIPLGARIVAIADAFDAMTTDRPYHRAGSIASALDELRHFAGIQWDPHLVDRFASTMTLRRDALLPREPGGLSHVHETETRASGSKRSR